MAWAASRYTEVRLDPICQELFRDIDQDAVDFVPNYDGKLTEPTLLPPVGCLLYTSDAADDLHGVYLWGRLSISNTNSSMTV